MNESLLIRNGRIIDPERGIDYTGSIFIGADGLIAEISRSEITVDGSSVNIIDAKGMIVCPGFIDFHCHLRQPGYEYKETVATGTLAAARGGFTTICCMPNTNPPIDSRDTIEMLKKTSDKEGIIRVIPFACVSEGRQGKRLSSLIDSGYSDCAGFSDDGSPVYDAAVLRKALEKCLDAGVPVSEHCEILDLAGDGVINEGKISAKLGLKGIPAAAEEDMVARDIGIARETGGWIHIAHASTAGSVELIRQAKADGVKITAEVTPHHLTLTEDEVERCGVSAKVNPPLRTRKDVEALIEGLKDGTIDIIATDHAPHAVSDKPSDMNKAAFGISGFETALGSLMTLVHDRRIEVSLLIEKLTGGPARLLGRRWGIIGSLQEDAPADIVIFDPEREWTVNAEEFASKGKNTPLDGKVLKGRVAVTIYNGNVAFKE
jgi:dihydroorotase